MALTEQAWKGIAWLYPQAQLLIDYRLDGQPPVVAAWNTTKLGPQPTDDQINAAITQYDAALTGRKQNEAKLKATVTTNLQSLVGKTWNKVPGKTQLTGTEKLDLAVGLFAKLGVLDQDTTVQPVDTWL